MKKAITAFFAAALAAITAFSIGGCGSSDKSVSDVSSQATTAASAIQSTADSTSASAATSPKEKPTGMSDSEPLNDNVIKAALDYCGLSDDDRDCVTLQKNEMAHDGSFYHFIYVAKDDSVIPLIVSYDAKSVYEPSDFFAKYGTVEEATAETHEPNHGSSITDETSANDDIYDYDGDEYNYDEDYYY